MHDTPRAARRITIYRDDSTSQVRYDDVKTFFWTADNTVLSIARYDRPEGNEHHYVHWPRERFCWFRDDPLHGEKQRLPLNSFFTDEPYGEPSRRLYLHPTEPAPGDGDDEIVQFGAVSADWFDFARRDDVDFESAPLSIVGIKQKFCPDEISVESPWYEAELSDDSTDGAAVDHFTSLFGDPRVRYLKSFHPASARENLNLQIASALKPEWTATEAQIRAVLELDRPPGAIAVYDVGQGNCNAILADDYHPMLYFDFGGGVTYNARTYPPGFGRFCFSSQKTIVLSHWDWDHWSSASRDRRALEQTWVVPSQRLGPIHRAFAAQIVSSGGKILVWPNRLNTIVMPHLELIKCNGNPRNDDGIAMRVFGPDEEEILMTGDAQYVHIPGILTPSASRLVGLVASHHGGRLRSKVPAPCAAGHALAYSYGPANTYGHALAATRNAHAAAGWSTVRETPAAAARPGHIAIGWGALVAGPPPCHGKCQLDIVQT